MPAKDVTAFDGTSPSGKPNKALSAALKEANDNVDLSMCAAAFPFVFYSRFIFFPSCVFSLFLCWHYFCSLPNAVGAPAESADESDDDSGSGSDDDSAEAKKPASTPKKRGRPQKPPRKRVKADTASPSRDEKDGDDDDEESAAAESGDDSKAEKVCFI